jgi:hypothetical protein
MAALRPWHKLTCYTGHVRLAISPDTSIGQGNKVPTTRYLRPEYLFSREITYGVGSLLVSYAVNPANPPRAHHIIPASATYETIFQIHECA